MSALDDINTMNGLVKKTGMTTHEIIRVCGKKYHKCEYRNRKCLKSVFCIDCQNNETNN